MQVSFEQDIILNPVNEYEVLQLLLGECRDRLTSYAGTCTFLASLLYVAQGSRQLTGCLAGVVQESIMPMATLLLPHLQDLSEYSFQAAKGGLLHLVHPVFVTVGGYSTRYNYSRCIWWVEGQLGLSKSDPWIHYSFVLGARPVRECACIGAHAGSAEEDLKILQQARLSEEERVAARLRMAEKRILQGTLDAVRRCGRALSP